MEMEGESARETFDCASDNENWTEDNDTDDDDNDDDYDYESECKDQSESETEVNSRESEESDSDRERRSDPPIASRRGPNGGKRTMMRKERRMVTPRKKNRVDSASRSSTPSLDEHPSEAVETNGASESGILLHGFCRSIPQLQDDPYRTIE
mmetsp:Transcript_32068/g.67225  ORF Transcript_32068/g.67225 Transcript_32068/m.67225 type:complete len:152 (-) Transcript_32068:336-791(-)